MSDYGSKLLKYKMLVIGHRFNADRLSDNKYGKHEG